MKMLHGEGRSDWPMGACVDPLAPKAGMSIPRGREIERLPIGRPIGPVFGRFFRDLDPGAFGNGPRSIDGSDHDPRAIWLDPDRKADPAIVGGEASSLTSPPNAGIS